MIGAICGVRTPPPLSSHVSLVGEWGGAYVNASGAPGLVEAEVRGPTGYWTAAPPLGQCRGEGPAPPAKDALEGNGPQRWPQKRLDRRLEEVAKAVGGGYCRLPLKLAIAVRETATGCRLGTLEGGGVPRISNASLPPAPPARFASLLCPCPPMPPLRVAQVGNAFQIEGFKTNPNPPTIYTGCCSPYVPQHPHGNTTQMKDWGVCHIAGMGLAMFS